MHNAIPRDARVLIVGCGNSSLSADMYDDGYRQDRRKVEAGGLGG